MKTKLLIVLAAFLLFNCDNNDDSIEVPRCLQSIIDNILETPIQNPRANIQRFKYNGNEVFLVNAQNFPDGQSAVISLKCTPICVLGGIDGPQNDCENFENAELIETIWTDSR